MIAPQTNKSGNPALIAKAGYVKYGTGRTAVLGTLRVGEAALLLSSAYSDKKVRI
jgi:hypothetical protein